MDDDLDLRDHRGRLTRLGISAAIGLVVTILVMHYINSVSRAPNADPVGSSELPLLAIGVFVVSTAFVSSVVARIRARMQS